MSPRVSVVLAVHNGEPFLEAALSSILRQTFGDLELIVVNDGSTDRSRDVVLAALFDAARETRPLAAFTAKGARYLLARLRGGRRP